MKKVLLFILAFAIFITGCSKSKDNGEFDYRRQLEETHGIKIPHRENLMLGAGPSGFGGFVADDILNVDGHINDFPWIGVFDLITKKLIFEQLFKNDPKEVDLGYGDIQRINSPRLSIKAKTDTHVYGLRQYDYYGLILFIGEIGTNKVIELDLNKGGVSTVLSWFNNSVFTANDQSRKYKIFGSGNKVLFEGDLMHRFLSDMRGFHTVSYEKFITYGIDEVVIFSLDSSAAKTVSYNPKDNDNDRVEIISVSSEGNIATIVFKVTTFANKITEKKVKLDFENYVMVD